MSDNTGAVRPDSFPSEDTRAFRKLYRDHYGFVWHAVARFGVRPPETDDAVQETFVTAYRRMREFAGGTPKPWLYGIARRIASNYRRGAHRTARRHAAVAANATSVSPATAHALRALDQFLSTLPESDRELFVLSEIEGLSGQEIIDALKLKPATAYRRIRSLRARVRETAPDPLFETVERARPRATQRTWAALLPSLGPAPAPAALTPWLSSWTVKATAVLAPAALVVAMGAAASSTTDEAPPEPLTTAQPVESTAATEHPATRTTVATEDPDVGFTPALAVAEPAIQRAPAQDKRAKTPISNGTSAQADALARDNALLRQVLAAASRGEPDRVLTMAAEHARTFPASPLADVRTALRIEALCALGKTAQARGEARTFLAAHPESAVADRVSRACKETPR